MLRSWILRQTDSDDRIRASVCGGHAIPSRYLQTQVPSRRDLVTPTTTSAIQCTKQIASMHPFFLQSMQRWHLLLYVIAPSGSTLPSSINPMPFKTKALIYFLLSTHPWHILRYDKTLWGRMLWVYGTLEQLGIKLLEEDCCEYMGYRNCWVWSSFEQQCCEYSLSEMSGMKLFEEECCDYYGLLNMSGTKLFGGRMSSLWAIAMSSGMKLFGEECHENVLLDMSGTKLFWGRMSVSVGFWKCWVQNSLRKNVMSMGYLSAEISTEKQETACSLRKSKWASWLQKTEGKKKKLWATIYLVVGQTTSATGRRSRATRQLIELLS